MNAENTGNACSVLFGLAVTSESSILSELIGDIYDAAIDPTLWLRALERSCDFVGGSSAVLYWHDVASESSAALHLFNDDPRYTQLYFEKYMPMNPVFPAATFIESGLIYTPTDIVPEAELFETRFHREWVEPQGIADVVCVNLEKSTTSSSVLNIRRDRTHGIVDDAVRRRAALIVPHFQRAVAIGRLFDQRKTAQAVLTETLDNVEAAIFLLGPSGRIVFVNGPARAMLDEGTLLQERRGVLAAAGSAGKAVRPHRERNPRARRHHEGQRRAGSGRSAGIVPGDGENPPAQPLPQDRNRTPERAREAARRLRAAGEQLIGTALQLARFSLNSGKSVRPPQA